KLDHQDVARIELLADDLQFDESVDPVASVTTVANGNGQGEVQHLYHNGDTGQFQLTFQGLNTVPLSHDASAGDVQQALENLILENPGDLAPIAPGDISVTGSGTSADPWVISVLKPISRVVGTSTVVAGGGAGDLAQ